jgi:hypothetical protein
MVTLGGVTLSAKLPNTFPAGLYLYHVKQSMTARGGAGSADNPCYEYHRVKRKSSLLSTLW